jgi:hypothetical protein
MTPEQAQMIVYGTTNHWANSEDVALVRAGWNAAMEAARKKLGTLSALDQADVFNVQDMLDWLDAQRRQA